MHRSKAIHRDPDFLFVLGAANRLEYHLRHEAHLPLVVLHRDDTLKTLHSTLSSRLPEEFFHCSEPGRYPFFTCILPSFNTMEFPADGSACGPGSVYCIVLPPSQHAAPFAKWSSSFPDF